jgi:hypothetical protein
MDKRINGKLHIYKYNGKKGEYLITHINKKAYFVIIKNNENGKFIERVNMKTQKPYTLYKGTYLIVNDIIFI